MSGCQRLSSCQDVYKRQIYNRQGTYLTVLPEKEWLSANTMQEGTRLFGTLPFLLYIVLQVALFVFRILLLHSDSLSGHRLHIFHRVPAFLPVSLRFSDVSGHNPVVVLSIVSVSYTHLSDGEKCGCKLLERFEITQPTLSHHMKILVGCCLVNDRKEGKWHHYSLNCETLMNYKHFIESLTCLGCGDGDCCK